MILNCGTEKPLRRKNRKGFSLTEMAIVLGVFGLILGGLWATVSLVKERARRDEAVSRVAIAVRNIREFYLGRGFVLTPAGVGTQAALTSYLLEQGILPAEMIKDRSAGSGHFEAVHEWDGGAFQICSAGCFSANSTSEFSVRFRSLPQGACVALATRLSGYGGASGLLKLFVNNNQQANLPLTVADAVAACSDPNSSVNNIELVYRLRPQR